MSSRDAILAAIRTARPPSVERPDLRSALPRSESADIATRFIAASESAAATVLTGDRANLDQLIVSAYAATGRQVSALGTITETDAPLAPHSFADTDVFICEAVIGVAENGAVWLPLSRLRHRAALFLAINVIVVLDRARLVGDMHDAYEAIDAAAEAFGVFVSGPSKTADIEQALVIGAHGAKSLTVLLVE